MSKYSQSQTGVAARDKMFMNILTLPSLFIYKTEFFFTKMISEESSTQSERRKHSWRTLRFSG